MPVHPVERKLAAILAADIAGYSRLMARDEVGTLAQLKTCRAIVDRLIAAHRGRIFNPGGDRVVAVRHLLHRHGRDPAPRAARAISRSPPDEVDALLPVRN